MFVSNIHGAVSIYDYEFKLLSENEFIYLITFEMYYTFTRFILVQALLVGGLFFAYNNENNYQSQF